MEQPDHQPGAQPQPAPAPGDGEGTAGGGLAAREAAVHVLYRVNHQGAWSNILIDGELSRGRLQGPDRGLFVRLVRGCLERQGALDWALGFYLQRPIDRLDPWPLQVLRLGAYQLMFMAVPGYAAVNTSVSLASRLAGRPAAGLVNAVLRRLSEGVSRLPWPDRFSDPLGFLSTHEGHPRWLVRRWLERFGQETAAALCAADNTPPGVTVRVNLLLTSRHDLMAHLSAAGFTATESILSPEALHIAGGGDLRRTAPYAAGHFVIQDEASMLMARALAPQAGEQIVDACAAPGGKATHLAALAGDRAKILAVDVNGAKLSQVRALASRLKLTSISTLEADARRLGAIAPQCADAVLLDAPCSGLGVLRRRPELRWRRKAEDLPALAAKQMELMIGVAPAVRPGGRLAYAVCSFEPEETEDVLVEFLASPAGRMFAPGEPVTLLPHSTGTDGFFYCVLFRKG